MGAHHHHHHHRGAAAAFRWSVLLNALLTGAQLAIGFGFGSLALIGDAIHNLGDVVGLLLAWGAERLSLRPARGRFTYGYGRSTHLAALINGLLVFGAGLLVVVEGARIRCVLRRIGKEGSAGIPNSGLIQINDIRIDTNKRQVFRGDERIRLTGMEFSLLELLVGRSGEPFSRGEILKEVWGYTPERHVDTRVVDVHISRLRSKLEDDPANPELILTARGTGYLFQRIVEAVAPESN